MPSSQTTDVCLDYEFEFEKTFGKFVTELIVVVGQCQPTVRTHLSRLLTHLEVRLGVWSFDGALRFWFGVVIAVSWPILPRFADCSRHSRFFWHHDLRPVLPEFEIKVGDAFLSVPAQPC
jgi:hypothetical protein